MRNMMLNLAVGLVFWFGQLHSAQAAPWRVELLEPPGTVNYDLDNDRPRLTTTGDGSLLAYPLSTRLRDNLDDEGYSAFARFGTTGATETFSTGTLGVNADGTLLADGSLVTVGTTVERVASDGTFVWSVLNPDGADYGRAHQMSNGDLLLITQAGPGLQIRTLSLGNGAVIGAAVVVPTSNQCYGLSAVGDGNGAWYVASSCIATRIVRLLESPLRLDANWQPTPAIFGLVNDAGNLAFKAGALYAATSTSSSQVLRKLDALTGNAIWTYPATGDDFRVGGILDIDGSEVLLRGSNAAYAPALQRVDAATGSLLWAHMPMGYVFDAVRTGNDVIIGGASGSSFDIDQARGYIERISLATGVSSWQTTLNAPQGGGSILSGVAIQGDKAVAIGAGCPLDTDGLPRCDATLWRNALDSGTSVEAAPVKVRTGNAQVGVYDSPPTQPLISTLEMGDTGPQLRTRRLAGSTGATLLDVVTPVRMTFPSTPPEHVSVIKAGDGNFIALLTTRRQPDLYPDAVVIKIDGSSGAVLWRHSLFDVSLDRKDLNIISVTSDSAGSAFFNLAYERQSGMQTESIMKLDASSGDVVWEVPVPRQPNTPLFASAPEMIGDDLLEYFYVPATGGAEWRRLRGADGSVVWSSATLPVFPNVVGDGYIYGTRVNGSALTVARIDPETGATVCSGTHVSSGDLLTPNGIPLRASDGDIYVVARRRTGTDYKALVVRFSGSTCVPIWANRYDETTSTNAQFYPRFVDSGVFYLSGRPAAFDVASANILTMVSSADGSLIGNQLMYQGSVRDPSSVRASGFPFGLDTDGGLILMAASREPSLPTRTVVEKRAAPASAVVGALRITANMMPAPMPGSAGFDFTINVVNDGAIVASNVRTVANFGTDVRLENVSCSLAGSPCQADIVGSTIRSTSNVPVGATLTLTGRASLPAASTSQISLTGSAFSPYGFSEMNMADNILPVMQPFRDRIFQNGVDSTP